MWGKDGFRIRESSRCDELRREEISRKKRRRGPAVAVAIRVGGQRERTAVVIDIRAMRNAIFC
jgi:hypothetical protein